MLCGREHFMFEFLKNTFKKNKNVNINKHNNIELRLNSENIKTNNISVGANTVNIETNSDNMFYERNMRGIELEKQGKIDEAIEFYELNVKSGIDGNHPYDRLAIIFRNRKQYKDEIRVLEKAIKVYSKIKVKARQEEINKKLNKFQTRLLRAKALYEAQMNIPDTSGIVK
jgi:tetratricopeptide (TPR) repeat protein